MAVIRSLSVVLLLLAAMLCSSTEAGHAASYLAAPVAAPLAYSVAAPIVPAQGVLRTAYSQVVGRSYAPSFVPVSTSLAYAAAPVAAPVVKAVPTVYAAAPVAAPVVKAVPTVYAAAPVAAPIVKAAVPTAYAAAPVAAPIVKAAVPTVYAAAPQLVAGPVLKTVRPYAVETPVAYAAPAFAAPAVRAAVPAPVFAPSVLSTRLAPAVPAVGVAPELAPAVGAPAPANSLPGVFDARAAAPASRAAADNFQRAFVTAFGSTEGIRLLGVAGGQAFEGAPTNVEIARAAPGGQEGGAQQGRSSSPGTVPTGRAASPNGPENFGVQQPQQQQPTPFNEYGLPVAAGAPINP
ncbi:AGAP005786-PA [Anopheles gambiae str. PEST]|uniref:AGAP005786-PA n=1 Tax=Anopheles gambiae TaxID=7165 RepID=Q5TRE6_ANOGA|nr:AGAP005786-PA [Anopheles gambiae str. PEST]